MREVKRLPEKSVSKHGHDRWSNTIWYLINGNKLQAQKEQKPKNMYAGTESS